MEFIHELHAIKSEFRVLKFHCIIIPCLLHYRQAQQFVYAPIQWLVQFIYSLRLYVLLIGKTVERCRAVVRALKIFCKKIFEIFSSSNPHSDGSCLIPLHCRTDTTLPLHQNHNRLNSLSYDQRFKTSVDALRDGHQKLYQDLRP